MKDLEMLPLTGEVQRAILTVAEHIARGVSGGGDPSYTSWVDLPKLDLADAVLRALGLPTEPARAILPVTPEIPFQRKPIPFIVRAKVMARDGFVCVRCGALENLTIDHIVPVSAGGSNDEANLRTLCARCNGSKGARLEVPDGA